MRETTNLNCKMQAHVRVCEENKLATGVEEYEKMTAHLKRFYRRLNVRYYSITVRKCILVCLLVMMLHTINVLILYYIYTIISISISIIRYRIEGYVSL